MTAAIGTRVNIRPSLAVGQDACGRWGEIVEGPRKMFGSTKYKVRIDLQGRETVQRTLWLPAASLLVPKQPKE
jgi:hypothetical protein